MLSVNERSVRCPGVSRRITEFAVKKLVLNPTETRQTDETEKTRANWDTASLAGEKVPL